MLVRKVVSREEIKHAAIVLFTDSVSDTGFRNVKFDSLTAEAQARWIKEVEAVLVSCKMEFVKDDSRL